MNKKNPAPKTPNPVVPTSKKAPAKKTVAKKTTKNPVPASAPDVAPSDEPKRLIPKAEPAQQPDEPKRLIPKAEPVQQAPAPAQTTPQRPPRNPEQQARWDSWQASKAQPWSTKGREARSKELASMSSQEREKESEKSKRKMGLTPASRGIGDRLKSAWKAFTAKPGSSVDIKKSYKSVFHEIQKLMEQLVVIEQALHEYGINESSLTTEQYTRLSERKHLIRKELAEQIIREELYMHNVTLAELSEQEKTALVNTVKSRCDEMWSSLNEYVQEQNNGFDDFDIGPQSDEEEMEYQDKPDEYVDTPEFDAHLASVNAKNSNNNLEEKLQHTKTGEEHGVETHTLSKDGKPAGWAKKKGGVVVGKLSGKNTQK